MKYPLLQLIKRVILTAIGVFLFYGCYPTDTHQPSQTQPNHFTISINTHRPFLEKAYLGKIKNRSVKIIDTVKLEQGKCVFSGKLQEPKRMALFFDNTSTEPFIFLLDKGNIYIDIDTYHISKGEIKNSPINDVYNTYQKNTAKIFQKINPFYFQLQRARLQNNAKELKQINSNIIAIENEFLQYSLQFIKNHSYSYASKFILKDLLQSSKIDSLTYQKEYKYIVKMRGD